MTADVAYLTCSGHFLVSPTGEIDIATAPRLRSEMVDATHSDCSLVVVDLSEVTFLDSVGISVIVGGHRRLRAEGRRLHLAHARPRVLRVLEITRVSGVIPTYASVDAAIADCPLPHVA